MTWQLISVPGSTLSRKCHNVFLSLTCPYLLDGDNEVAILVNQGQFYDTLGENLT